METCNLAVLFWTECKTPFLGTIVSFLAYKIYEFKFVVDLTTNQKHIIWWFFLLKEHNIDVLLELSIDKYINFEYIPPSR